MIDWLDAVFQLTHTPIPAGIVASIAPDGQLEWQTPKSLQVTGSYEKNVRVRSQGGTGDGNATELYVSGNPAKFLQGHNIFGSDDLLSLAHEMAARIFQALDITNDLALQAIKNGDFDVKRIDITNSFAFANRNEVQAVLSALAVQTRSRMGRAQTRGGTVYHGKNSRRWTLKYYCKAEELEAGKKHRLPDQLQNTPLKEHSENLLRAEVTLRSMELKRLEITRGKDFTPETVRRLYADYFGNIQMSAQAHIASEEIQHLPRAIRSSYLLWQSGTDVRNMMSQSTFYRHRAQLLPLGVDIALPNEDTQCHVIPLFRQVTGTPAGIPEWAYKQGLVFDPQRIGG